ncbi:MAG: NYN domain-containing protein [Promethearchaeota archaeon]
MTDDEVAIFWDYENVSAMPRGINVPLAEALVAYAESLGHPRMKKVYSNWKPTSDTVIQALYSLGFETIQVSMGKSNSVDVKLTADCINTAHEILSIKQFIIVTGDKDYIPLVNALKERRKHDIIIGRSDVVSDHLMMSASGFVSLEELSKLYIDQEPEILDFEDSIKCLSKAIGSARGQGKSSRFEVIDALMRGDEEYNYKGASSVKKSDSEVFRSFSEFIAAVEEAGKIKTQTIEGFKELFLPEEDPNVESEFSPMLSEEITKEHWNIIFEQVERSFREGKPPLYGRFLLILNYIRAAKKEGLLPYSNKTLRDALSKIVEVGALIRQPDESYRLIENYETTKDIFLNRLIMEQDST